MVRRFSLSRRQSLWIALSAQKRSAEEGDKWVHISSMTWKGSCFALSQCHKDLILMQSLPLQKIPGKKRLISHECSSCQLCLLHKVPGASYSCWWEPNTHARTWEWWTKEKGTQIIWHFSSSGEQLLLFPFRPPSVPSSSQVQPACSSPHVLDETSVQNSKE